MNIYLFIQNLFKYIIFDLFIFKKLFISIAKNLFISKNVFIFIEKIVFIFKKVFIFIAEKQNLFIFIFIFTGKKVFFPALVVPLWPSDCAFLASHCEFEPLPCCDATMHFHASLCRKTQVILI